MKKENNIQGTIGTMNYKVKDCPFYIPKENQKFFSAMQKASSQSMVSTYGNSYISSNIFANKKSVDFV